MSGSCPTHEHTNGAMVVTKMLVMKLLVLLLMMLVMLAMMRRGAVSLDHSLAFVAAGFGPCWGRCSGAAISLRRGAGMLCEFAVGRTHLCKF